MNIVDLRKNLRRASADRRGEDRRKNPYDFGTAEWVAYIKFHNLQLPEFDRRQGERRSSEDRRLPDRRQYQEEPPRFEKKYARIFLTPAERKLMEDVFLNDLD